MLAERLSLSASTAFVITTALGLLLCLSLLASIGFVMTNPFARVSVTLSKHCFWTPKINLPQCLSVLASIGFGHPNPSCRLSATLCKHRLCNDQRFISCFDRTVVRSSQASRLDIQRLMLVKHPQTPLVFNNSFTSKGEQQ